MKNSTSIIFDATPNSSISIMSTSPSPSASGTTLGASLKMPSPFLSSAMATRRVEFPVPNAGAPTIQVAQSSVTGSPYRSCLFLPLPHALQPFL